MRTDIKLTVEDYMALPDGGPRYQLIEGDFVLSPAPNIRHQRLLLKVASLLQRFAASENIGEAFCAPVDVFLADINVVQPDVLYVSRERKDIVHSDGIHGPPDLCIEILSTQRDLDFKTKRHVYAKHGVIEYWIVDPDADSIHLLRLQESVPDALFRAPATLTTAILPGLVLDLKDLFAE
jgi:Uma2 family endonuclease